ncbi:MAG: shikimate kinase AroK [Gammaproteobacteria bacterium]|nr:shikimate kinase AroK [Gammaproteobacteria bacterium]MDH5592509.1 shikimate kinase AroK [Gammaproteobacteria bacterium]
MISGNIFLVGPMGSGKSTVGRQLAKALGRDFYDSDKEIEKRTGVSISWIFEMEGEAGFRLREKKVIDELTELKNIVLATGGGAVLAEENRRLLRSRGHVVYLSASVDQLYRRTVKDKSRPLLQTDNPKQQITDLLAKRDPLYRDVADIELRTGDQSIQHVVSDLIKELESLGQ